MTKPFVSVIIPVYQDQQGLDRCLTALGHQTYPADRYEIIVVDNASSPPIQIRDRLSIAARLVRESQAGSYAARNWGIAVARGDILAFTDADCEPDEAWLACGVARLTETPQCGLVGGRIEVVAQRPGQPSWIEAYDLITAFPQQRYVEEEHFAVTANLFTYRQVVDAVGEFDANLKSAGDSEWGRRVYDHGLKLAYAPDAWVRHPACASLSGLRARAARKAGGYYDKKKARRSWLRKLGGVMRAFAPPVARLIRLAGDSRIRGPIHYLQLVSLVLFVHYAGAIEHVRLTAGGQSKRG